MLRCLRLDLGIKERLRATALVALISIAAVLALSLGVAPAGSSPSPALLPDLNVERPSEIYITKGRAATRLRTSNTVSNIGAGPLEIFPGDSGQGCEGGGRQTKQRVFQDSANADSPGFFDRKDDTATEVIDSGCSRYHPTHDHWHFDNFARYRLIRESNGTQVGTSRKISFCVIDTGHPNPDLPGSPEESYYPQDPDDPDAKFPTCSATTVDGLSIGWEDTYGAALPGQGINITGLRGKRFCLILEADPPGKNAANGYLAEAEEHDNNMLVQRLRTTIRKAQVKPLNGECRAKLPTKFRATP